MARRFILFCITLFLAATCCMAQTSNEFKVLSFKRLDWDLDAWVSYPVKDQNGRKAALIKIIMSDRDDFTFDVGIMGVVEKRNHAGEIWLYVPEKVRKITITHPRYGVIRDWPFPEAIESGVVYEMRLQIPVQDTVKVIRDTVVKDSVIFAQEPRKPLGISVMAVGAVPDPSFGIMAVWRPSVWGAYFKCRSNFNAPSTEYSADSGGSSAEGYIWTDGTHKVSRLLVTAGCVRSLNKSFGVYAGGGYGCRKLIWRDVSGRPVKIEDRSREGVAIEAGVIFNVKMLSLSLGGSMTAFHYPDAELGVGISF